MKLKLVVAMLMMGTLSAYAAEETSNTKNQSTLKVDAVKKENKDIDNEITNARLRAQLGSKSRWSVKTALGYSGGSISNPTSNVRPNYRAGATREGLPALSGTVGVNYRLTERDNLSFGTGITVVDPLHGNITQNATDGRKGMNNAEMKRYQISTPGIDWSRGYKAFGTQMISSLGYSHYTDSDSSQIKAIGDVSFSQTVLANLGDSRWSGGLSGTLGYSIYGGAISDQNVAPMYESGVYKRDDMVVGLYPFAEYSFTDRYSFRTVFGYFEFLKYKEEYGNNTKFFQREPYQSVGVGISVTRDIYLYPNVQFAPKDIRADRTNVALSTNINI